eukprot:1195724-Prorocentrum_minimum.AAC.4
MGTRGRRSSPAPRQTGALQRAGAQWRAATSLGFWAHPCCSRRKARGTCGSGAKRIRKTAEVASNYPRVWSLPGGTTRRRRGHAGQLQHRWREWILRAPERILRAPEKILRAPEGILRAPEGILRAPEGILRAPEGILRAPG